MLDVTMYRLPLCLLVNLMVHFGRHFFCSVLHWQHFNSSAADVAGSWLELKPLTPETGVSLPASCVCVVCVTVGFQVNVFVMTSKCSDRPNYEKNK